MTFAEHINAMAANGSLSALIQALGLFVGALVALLAFIATEFRSPTLARRMRQRRKARRALRFCRR